MEAEKPERDAWALDVSALESADVIDGLQNASLEGESGGGGDEADELNAGDRAPEPGRVEMDATGSPASGGMGISDEEINKGTAEIFDGVTKVLSGMAGQDLTPTDAEKDEAGKKLGPLVQRRFPTVREYTLETAALLWVLGYFNEKADLSDLMG